MAQQNLDLGIVGDDNTGHYVWEAMSIIEDNFNDLYTNFMQKLGGTFTGNINFAPGANINNVETIKVWNQTSQNNSVDIDMPTDNDFSFTPSGSGITLAYDFGADKWEIDGNEVLSATNVTASQVSSVAYLEIGSTNVQSAIEELKDEIDAVVASSGSGDMLKATYDTGPTGVVDNSEGLNGNNSAYHLSRTNHTGTQLASTISDFDTAVDANAGVIANTAKITNATHTADVTGATALTIDPTAISGKALVTAVATDMVLLWDASDSMLKRADVSDMLTGVTLDSTIQNGSTNAVENNAIFDALFNVNAWVNTNNIEANKIIDGTGSGLDADLFHGFNISTPGNRWGVISDVRTNGVIEIGKYIDFHETDGDTGDYAARLESSGGKLITWQDILPDTENTKNLGSYDKSFGESYSGLLFLMDPTGTYKGWRLSGRDAGDDLTFGAETTAGTNTWSAKYKLNDSGAPVDPSDLVNLSYADSNYAPTTGTFTPSIVQTGTAGYTYSVQAGRTIKYKNLIYFEIELLVSNISGTPTNATLYITGMPYTPLDTSGFTPVVMGNTRGFDVGAGNCYTIQASMNNGTGDINFIYDSTGNGAVDTAVNSNELTGGTKQIYLNGTFYTTA